jgi:hypothetical protein
MKNVFLEKVIAYISCVVIAKNLLSLKIFLDQLLMRNAK